MPVPRPVPDPGSPAQQQGSYVVAPIAPHMAEEAFTALPYEPSDASVFLRGWVDAPNEWTAGMDDDEAGFWATVLAIRGEVNRAIETARGDKTLGASLEAKAVIYASDTELAKTIESRAVSYTHLTLPTILLV